MLAIAQNTTADCPTVEAELLTELIEPADIQPVTEAPNPPEIVILIPPDYSFLQTAKHVGEEAVKTHIENNLSQYPITNHPLDVGVFTAIELLRKPFKKAFNITEVILQRTLGIERIQVPLGKFKVST